MLVADGSHLPCHVVWRKGKAGLESEIGQTDIQSQRYFLPLWGAGKNPIQSFCRSTVRVVPPAKRG
jgi:hypothetical protein